MEAQTLKKSSKDVMFQSTAAAGRLGETIGESGYSLLEVLMAMAVMTVGMVSLLALFSQSLITMYLVQEDLIAEQKCREALESIYTARNTQMISFVDIQNAPAPGVFLAGFQPLKIAGSDGLVGTGDDGAIETISLPGPNGTLGDGDDINRVLTNFDRQIQINSLSADLREILVTVRYTTSEGWQRSYQLSSYISRYR